MFVLDILCIEGCDIRYHAGFANDAMAIKTLRNYTDIITGTDNILTTIISTNIMYIIHDTPSTPTRISVMVDDDIISLKIMGAFSTAANWTQATKSHRN